MIDCNIERERCHTRTLHSEACFDVEAAWTGHEHVDLRAGYFERSLRARHEKSRSTFVSPITHRAILARCSYFPCGVMMPPPRQAAFLYKTADCPSETASYGTVASRVIPSLVTFLTVIRCSSPRWRMRTLTS